MATLSRKCTSRTCHTQENGSKGLVLRLAKFQQNDMNKSPLLTNIRNLLIIIPGHPFNPSLAIPLNLEVQLEHQGDF